MQALSSYKPEQHSLVQSALMALADAGKGFSADSYFSERGLFARFVWPDWPASVAQGTAARVEGFHKTHPELRRRDEGAEEWKAVFRDWRADPESASVIGEAFSKCFPARVLWVESERDARGRIAARCLVRDLGETTLNLFWRDSLALPPPNLSDSDRGAFSLSVGEIFQWAGRRIHTVLSGLHDQLQNLYGDRFRGLYVFGSYARPDAGVELSNDSDLDVALILSDFDEVAKEIDRCSKTTADLTLKHGVLISLVPIREADYRTGRTNFIRVISEDAIQVG